MVNNRYLVLLALIAGTNGLQAQDEEKFLPVIIQVMMEGARASEFTVTVFTDNAQVALLEPSKHGTCELMLSLNTFYSIRITKPGFREKLLSVDTHLPADIVRYKAYPCTVDLESATLPAADSFYIDFPNAIIRWDASIRQFEHSDHYLEGIRAKTMVPGDRIARN